MRTGYIYITLTIDEQKFLELLKKKQEFIKYWNFKKRSVDYSSIEHDIRNMSSTDALLMRFYLSVWEENNGILDFDVINAISTLDLESCRIILEWVRDPFFPNRLAA